MKSRNLAVGGLVAVLVIAVWFLFLYKPAKSETSKVNKEVKEAERKSLGLEAQLAQVSDKARNAQTKKDLATLHAAVPASPQLASFIRGMNKIAAQSQVSWQSIAPTQQQGVTSTNTIGVSIEVAGSYASVLDYMQRLQDLPRLVIVDNVDISSAQGSTDMPPGGGGGVFTNDSQQDTGLKLKVVGRMFTAAPAAPAGATTGASSGATSNVAPAAVSPG